MIRDNILLWASIGLVIVLAFIILPSYEKFKDKGGNEVDVAPGAPPMPEWLRPMDETTGRPTGEAPATGYEYQSWLNKESYRNIFGEAEPTASRDPLPKGEILPQNTHNGKVMGMDYLKENFANWFVSPIRETYTDTDGEDHPVGELPQSTTVTVLPPPTTVASNKPSGVRTIPSQSMPPNPLLGTSPNIGPVKNTQNMTLPPPDFSKGGSTEAQNRYVLKSSLVPCTCASKGGGPSCSQHAGSYPGSTVPGSMDGEGALNEDEKIQKPFSVAFAGETNPVGYLNSFAAFSK